MATVEKVELKTAWQLLRAKYPIGECVLLEEVSDKTGRRNRSADFIVVNLWPSRGNSIIGFEKKTYRSDWLNELKNPEKQEAIFKYCDYFYLLTDRENVAKIEEIPENWGWVHSDGKRLKVIKEAVKLNPVPCTRGFVCSMLRRADSKDGFVRKEEIEDRIKSAVESAIARENQKADYKAKEYDNLIKRIEAFKEASGIDIESKWSWRGGKEIGEAVKKVMTLDECNPLGRLTQLQTYINRIQEQVQSQIDIASEVQKNIN